MYVIKIIFIFLVTNFSQTKSEDYASQSFDFSSESARAAELTSASINEEYRSHSTEPFTVVSIGYTKRKPDVSAEQKTSHPTTESYDLKTSSSHHTTSDSPFPVGYDQSSSTQSAFSQSELKLASPSTNYDIYSSQYPPQYIETTLSPPVFEHYTAPAKYQTKNEDHLYEPTRSPILNHQSNAITVQYDKHSSIGTTTPNSQPSFEYKGTPAPLPPQYGHISPYNTQQNHFSSFPQQVYQPHSPQIYSQPPSTPAFYSSPPPLPQQYEFPSQPPPIPYDFISQVPPLPPQYQPAPSNPHLVPHKSHEVFYTPASSSIHLSTSVTTNGEIGTTTPSIYDISTVAPLQPQYDFIRENYENTDTSLPPPIPQGYEQFSSLSPPLPPQYADPSPYLSLPNSQNYLENIYRPYSTPLRKHNPSPSFEFNPTPHNPTHYIHNIPHYLTPSYDAYTRAPHPNGGHPHYYKPLYNPYNPSVPQHSPGGFQPYGQQASPSQSYPAHYSSQIPQYEQYNNNYPTIYRPPVPPNYQPHLPPKSHTTLYHVQASKELNPSVSPSPSTEKTHELKETKAYKDHGYHNYQVAEQPLTYSVQEG